MKGRRVMYDVKEFHFGRSSPVEVQVSFSLSGPDWSKFEKSDSWQKTAQLLEYLQTEQYRTQTQGKKAESE